MNTTARIDPRADNRAISHRSLSAESGRLSANGLWSTPSRNLLPACATFLGHLVKSQILPNAAAEQFVQFHADRLADFTTTEKIGRALVAAGLLTKYQMERVLTGAMHGLVLGNYRVLDRLGGGSVGVVFLAEHMLLKRKVAIKVLPTDDDFPQSVLDRFYGEMRVLAQLNHPHIVSAYDAGVVHAPDAKQQTLHYLVMELLESDLEQYVYDHGTVPLVQACEWIRQAASGLLQAHDHHLIHRDLKPSNLLLDENNRIRIVDFGLAREFQSNRTEPRSLLGSIEFMPPEQSIDPTSVRAAADIHGLGATLFWLVSGHTPYPREQNVADAIRRLQTEQPRRLSEFLPTIPSALDDLVAQMLDRNPDRRPESARAVMMALTPFANSEGICTGPDALDSRVAAISDMDGTVVRNVLILDDDAPIRKLARAVIEPMGVACHEAKDSLEAMEIISATAIDLILLDIRLPDVSGYDICAALRAHPPWPHLKLILTSGYAGPDERATALEHGADDFLAKPLAAAQLAAAVQHQLRLKGAQDRVDQLARNLMTTNTQLEQSLETRERDIRQAEDALLFGMAKMAEMREGGTARHLRRLQRFSVCIAERLREEPGWEEVVDNTFIEHLQRCVPLHDIGKIALPDALIHNTGALTDEERKTMETHTTIGASLIDAIAKEYGQSLDFLNVARAIVRHHHERFDGRGYPDRLSGEDIPAAARIVILADVYDSLRRQRPHRQPMTHSQAVRVILFESPGIFDPTVLRAFGACQEQFQRIFETVGA